MTKFTYPSDYMPKGKEPEVPVAEVSIQSKEPVKQEEPVIDNYEEETPQSKEITAYVASIDKILDLVQKLAEIDQKIKDETTV